MKENLSNSEDVGYLFNVDILIKSRSNALAMQSLLELLNAGEPIADFRSNPASSLAKLSKRPSKRKRLHYCTARKKVQVQAQAQPTAPAGGSCFQRDRFAYRQFVWCMDWNANQGKTTDADRCEQQKRQTSEHSMPNFKFWPGQRYGQRISCGWKTGLFF